MLNSKRSKVNKKKRPEKLSVRYTGATVRSQKFIYLSVNGERVCSTYSVCYKK